MIIVYDHSIKMPIIIYDPVLSGEITGDTFMKFGHSDEVVKLPKGHKITSIKDGVITIDLDDQEKPPLHYWEP